MSPCVRTMFGCFTAHSVCRLLAASASSRSRLRRSALSSAAAALLANGFRPDPVRAKPGAKPGGNPWQPGSWRRLAETSAATSAGRLAPPSPADHSSTSRCLNTVPLSCFDGALELESSMPGGLDTVADAFRSVEGSGGPAPSCSRSGPLFSPEHHVLRPENDPEPAVPSRAVADARAAGGAGGLPVPTSCAGFESSDAPGLVRRFGCAT